jgi:methyltransferase (TIGR00027 family)
MACKRDQALPEASRTAQYMALFRALETRRPGGQFDDPYAERFLSPRLRRVIAASRLGPVRELVCRYIDRRGPGARTSAVARTKAIDDLLADPPPQVVFLGAGYDTRALRLEALRGAHVFELDQPEMLAAKRAALGAGENVEHVEIDFARDAVLEALEAAGFDRAQRTAFVWEGVTNYLTAEAVDATLRALAETAPGSRLIFTYVHRGVIDGSVDFEGGATLRAEVASVGEPWTFGLRPEELEGYLRERGLELVSDEGADDYRRRLLGDSPRNLRGYAFYRLAVAEVATAPPA